MKKISWIFLFFFVFLTLPDWLLFFNLNTNFDIGWIDFFNALKVTLLQATLTSIGAIIFGVIIALGLLVLKSRYPRFHRITEFLCLVPNFTPVIFTALVFLQYFKKFPYGLVGVVLVQVFINAGYIGVYISNALEQQLWQLSEICAIDGVSFISFFIQGLKVIKKQILTSGFFVFTLCLSSFALPLLLGGGHLKTLEILVYEKIRINASFDVAFNISILQAALVFATAFFIKPQAKQLPQSSNSLILCSSKFLSVIPLAYSLGFIGFFLFSLLKSLLVVHLSDLSFVFATIPLSLIFSWSVGLLVFILLLLFSYGLPNPMLNKHINGLIQPSTVLMGLAILYIQKPQLNYFFYILGFSSLIFLSIYRMGWLQELSALTKSVRMAQVLGANDQLIFDQINRPLISKRAAYLASIASFWALGDFALGKIIFNKDQTLALNLQTLINNYRLQAGFVVCGIILCLCALNFLLFKGLGYVFSQKSL